MAEYLQVSYHVSQRKACYVLGFARSSHRYNSTADRHDFLRIRLRDLTAVRVNYGYRRLHILLGREGTSRYILSGVMQRRRQMERVK